MKNNRREWLSAIERRGGAISRRRLDPEQARAMVRVREARRAYRTLHATCFRSFRKDLVVVSADVPWVAEQLMKHGGRAEWLVGSALCR